jgi:hypothetical protein
MLVAPDDYLDSLLHARYAGLSVWSYPLLYQLLGVALSFPIIFFAWIAFLFAAAWGYALRQRDIRLDLWLLCSVVGMSLGGNWWTHYFQQITPPLAIIAALGARGLWRARNENPGMVLVARVAVVLVGLSLLFWSYLTIAPSATERLVRVVYHDPRYEQQAEMVTELQNAIPVGSTLYIAYSGGEVQYLADRKSPIKYLFVRDLNFNPAAYQNLIETFSDPVKRPDFVLNASHSRMDGVFGDSLNARASNLQQFLARDYVPQIEFARVDRDTGLTYPYILYRKR